MAGRPMTARLRVRGWLRLAGAVHVGGVDHDPNAPMEAAVDGRGHLYVPGTSLAGPLRPIGAPAASDPLDRWGSDLHDMFEADATKARASRIVVRDALVTRTTRLDSDGEPADVARAGAAEPRPGVGIDRYLGAAAPGILYERAVLPAGLFLRFGLDLESTVADLPADRVWLAALLDRMAGGDIRLGAGKSRGLGRVELLADGLTVAEERLDSRAGLLDLLRSRARTWSLAELIAAHPPETLVDQTMAITIDWSPAAPVMVRGPADGIAVQALPLVTVDDATHVRLLLPGSSVKGTMRSHAERILRTVADWAPELAVPTGDGAQRSRIFRAQHTGLALVNAIFGAPPKAGKERTDKDTTGAGAVRVEDCFSKTSIPRALWDRLFTDDAAITRPKPDQRNDGDQPAAREKGSGMSEELRKGLADLGLERADHVAIDRWTGGAAPGRLFSVLEPHGVTWEPIRITVDLRRLCMHAGIPTDAALALLLLVLRDVKAGRVAFGYATHRGLGDIAVSALTVRSPDWPGGAELDDALRSDAARRMTDEWCAYLDAGGQP